jgi:hypothetical protein
MPGLLITAGGSSADPDFIVDHAPLAPGRWRD